MTNTKSVTKNVNAWALKSRVTGRVYPSFSYPTRSAARKASKGRRFKGEYFPVKMDTTVDIIVMTKPATATTPKYTYKGEYVSKSTFNTPNSKVRKDPTNFSNFVSKMGFHPFWITFSDAFKGK
jgi:hypothetical protein